MTDNKRMKLLYFLRKFNAYLSLLTALLLIFHIFVISYSYLTFTYIPTIIKISGRLTEISVFIHIIVSLLCVFLLKKNKERINSYPKLNIETIIQRITAILSVFLMVLHIVGNKYLFQDIANWQKQLIYVLQIFFYFIILLHVTISISRGLISIGIITNCKQKSILNIIIYIVMALVFVLAIASLTYLFVKMGWF